MGACVKFKGDEDLYPISFFEEDTVEVETLTEKQIKDWFKNGQK